MYFAVFCPHSGLGGGGQHFSSAILPNCLVRRKLEWCGYPGRVDGKGKGRGGMGKGSGGDREKEGKGRGGACLTNQKIVLALLDS